MKLLILLVLINLVIGDARAGFSIGAAGTVRQRVKKLDSQVVNQQNELIMADTTPPEPPSALNAVLITVIDIKLTWKDNSQNETHFVVERADDNLGTQINWQVASGNLTAGTEEYTDRALAGETVYWYRVKAVNGSVSSGYSNTAKCTTDSVGGGRWVDADGFGRESINISQTSRFSYGPSLCLYSTGNPHIAWHQYTTGVINEIYYLKWDGNSWVDVEGSSEKESINISQTDGGSYSPSMCLDSQGYPHIAWRYHYLGNSGIYYLKWNGNVWVDATGSSSKESIKIPVNGSSPYYPSLCLDSTDKPHIVWRDTISGDTGIYYLKWGGSGWVDIRDSSDMESIKIPETSPSIYMRHSFCLDSSNRPHIAFAKSISGNWEIYYLKWNGDEWVDAGNVNRASANISQTSGTSEMASLYLDSENRPHIAWWDRTSGNSGIYYLRWNGASWVDAAGSAGKGSINIFESSNVDNTSLCLDSSNNAHIAFSNYHYSDEYTGYQIYYLQWKDGAWVDADGDGQESINISNTYGNSRNPKIHLDSGNKPHIVWEENNTAIYYLKYID